MKKLIALWLTLASAVVMAQNPQSQNAPIFSANAKYTNGTAPGYWATMGTGLILNLGAGTPPYLCSTAPYAGGTLTMTASVTNYVFLNSASACIPSVKTSVFGTSDIPIAVVVTGSSTITSINDLRMAPITPSASTTVSASVVSNALIGTSGGAAQSQTVTLNPAVGSLSAGLNVRWIPIAANTGSGTTLAISGLTATVITKCGGNPVSANDMIPTVTANVIYNVTSSTLELQNPQATPCGTSPSGNATSIQSIAVAGTSPVPRTAQTYKGYGDNTYAPDYPLASEVLDNQAQNVSSVACTAFTEIAAQMACIEGQQQLQNIGIVSPISQVPTPTYMWALGQVPSTLTGSTGCTSTPSLTAWSSATSYAAGNGVSSGGFNWLAQQAVTSGGSAPSAGANWQLLPAGFYQTSSATSIIGGVPLAQSALNVNPCSPTHTGGPEAGVTTGGTTYNITNQIIGAGNFGFYSPASGTTATLSTTTTVLRYCYRPDPWMHITGGTALPTAGNSAFKSGEWYFNVANSTAHSATHQVGGFGAAEVTPVVAPKPSSEQYFGNSTPYPAGAPADYCEWLFYDTGAGTLGGTTGAPVVAGSFNDGVIGTPVTLGAALSTGTAFRVASASTGADSHTLTIWTGASAGKMFSQSLRSLEWNNGMNSNVFNNFIQPAWSQLSKTYLNPAPIALGGDAIDNVTAQQYPATSNNFTDAGGNYTITMPGWVRTSPFTTYSVTVTNATGTQSPSEVCFRSQQGTGLAQSLQDIGQNLRFVSFDIDGVYANYSTPANYGPNYLCIGLTTTVASHTIRFFNGTTIAAVYTLPYATATPISGGPFIDAIGVPKGYVVTVNHLTATTGLTWGYGHSVMAGHGTQQLAAYNTGVATTSSWFTMSRKLGAFGGGTSAYNAGTWSAICDCYGSRLIWSDFQTPTMATAYMAALKLAQPSITRGIVEEVINSRFHGPNSTNQLCLVPATNWANSFMATYANLANSWHVAWPSFSLYIGSDIVQSSGNEASLDACTYSSGTVTNLNTIIALGALNSEPTAPSCTTSGCNYAAWRRVLYNSVQNPTNSTVQLFYNLTAPSSGLIHGWDMTGCMTQAQIGADGIHPGVQGHVGITGCVQTLFGTTGAIIPPL